MINRVFHGMLAEDDRNLSLSLAEVSFQGKEQSSFAPEGCQPGWRGDVYVITFLSSFCNRLLQLVDCFLRILQPTFAHKIPSFAEAITNIRKEFLVSGKPFIVFSALLIQIEKLIFGILARRVNFERAIQLAPGQVLKPEMHIKVSQLNVTDVGVEFLR